MAKRMGSLEGTPLGQGERDRLRARLNPVSAALVGVAVAVFGVVGFARVFSSDQTAPVEVVSMQQSEDVLIGEMQPGYGLEGQAEAEQNQDVVVHVTGEVHDPGVVVLQEPARVVDAVEAAGGLTADAEIASVNLAAYATDGSHVHIAAKGQGPANASPAAGAPVGGGCIDVNTADETQLQELDGVGPKLAARIAEHRATNGAFESLDRVTDVSGIGPVLLERIRVDACE